MVAAHDAQRCRRWVHSFLHLRRRKESRTRSGRRISDSQFASRSTESVGLVALTPGGASIRRFLTHWFCGWKLIVFKLLRCRALFDGDIPVRPYLQKPDKEGGEDNVGSILATKTWCGEDGGSLDRGDAPSHRSRWRWWNEGPTSSSGPGTWNTTRPTPREWGSRGDSRSRGRGRARRGGGRRSCTKKLEFPAFLRGVRNLHFWLIQWGMRAGG